MRSGWYSIEKDAKEFALDVHVVTQNFWGEQGWRWIDDKKEEKALNSASEGQVVPSSRLEKFKDEMMLNTQFYSNHSQLTSRVMLGVTASLYSLVYLPVRLVYDGVLNIYEYGAWRITGQPYRPLLESHQRNPRKPNAYVIGAPVSAAPILIMGAVEGVGRAAGISSYGGAVIRSAGRRAANISSRYTSGILGTYSEDDMKADQATVLSLPNNGWETVDRVGLVTLPGAIAATEMLGAVAITAVCGATEVGGRAAGISSYGGAVIRSAGRRAANISSRYTSGILGTYSEDDMKADQATVLSLPNNGWETVDRVGLVTLPGAIAATEMLGAVAIVTTCGLIEGSVRSLGVSERSSNGISYIFARIGNMFGVAADAAALTVNVNKITAPIQSGWDVCDCIGTLISGAISTAVGVLAMPLALIGFSKSNWHRFNYYKNLIDNAIDDRRGKNIDRTAENYHKTELEKCEQSTLGNIFSKANVFNLIGTTLYGLTRWIIGPIIYGTFRAVKQLFGVVPLATTVANKFSPPQYDNSNPIDRVRKRFAELSKSLDLYGRLSYSLPPKHPSDAQAVVTPVSSVDDVKGGPALAAEPVSGATTLDITESLRKAEQRSKINNALFTIKTEARKIFSLGHSPEERVIAEFRDKFEEFVSMSAAENRGRVENAKVNVNSFFKDDIRLSRGRRFSYNHMVESIKGRYTSFDDRAVIDKVAEMIKNDINGVIELSSAPRPANAA